MNPFLKAHSCALHEQVHVAAWPVYPPASSRRDPDPYTNISETQSEHVTPAYAYETGTWTLAPSQVVSRQGARRNLPRRLRDNEAALDAEATVVGNGFARAYRPDGSRAVADPPKTFDGIFVVDIDLDENVLTKRLADFVRPPTPRAFLPFHPLPTIRQVAHRRFPGAGRPLHASRPDPTAGRQDSQDVYRGCQFVLCRAAA